MKLDYDPLAPHERSLKYLVDSITQAPNTTSSTGFEKSTTVRFNEHTYPKVKAIANLSGNSLSSVVNDLVLVAYGSIVEKITDSEVKRLQDEGIEVHKEWIAEINKGNE